MHSKVHTNIYTYTHTYIYLSKYIYIHTYENIYADICMQLNININRDKKLLPTQNIVRKYIHFLLKRLNMRENINNNKNHTNY